MAIVPALTELIADRGAADLFVGSSEVLLDGIIDNEAIRDIPIVGSLIGLVKAGFGVRDYLFLNKLARFLTSLQEIDYEDRHDFKIRIEEDNVFRERVGQKIIILLDRADDMDKPDLLGKAFAAYLSGAVTFEQFSRMAAGIDRCLILDLKLLSDAKYGRIDDSAGANLLPSGLVFSHVSQLIGGNHTSYPLTEAGKLVKEYCLS